MRSLLVAALFFAAGLRAEAGPSHCNFRVHVEANQQDGAAFAQPIRSLTGRDVFIEKTAWLSERDVKRYYPYRAADGSYAALLELGLVTNAVTPTSLRFAPPLTVTEAELDQAVAMVAEVLK